MTVKGKNSRRKKGRILMAAGIVLLLSSVIMTAYNLWDDHRAAKVSADALSALEEGRQDRDRTDMPAYIPDPDMEMPVKVIDGIEYIGRVDIPDLELSLPVISTWSMDKLRTAPCRYAGSAYKSGFVIAGHNYQAHFSRIKSLEPGSEIDFTDVNGIRFRYEMTGAEILQPEETKRMKDTDFDLSLFTCTYGGGSRYTVRCVRLEEQEIYGESR